MPLSASLPHVKSAVEARRAVSVWRRYPRPRSHWSKPTNHRPAWKAAGLGGLRGWAGCVLIWSWDQLFATNLPPKNQGGVGVCPPESQYQTRSLSAPFPIHSSGKSHIQGGSASINSCFNTSSYDLNLHGRWTDKTALLQSLFLSCTNGWDLISVQLWIHNVSYRKS